MDATEVKTEVTNAAATVQADAMKAYGFWNSVAAWVAAHPKTTVVIAVAVVVGVVALAI